ncbi:PhzF family phenazine biosynthesis protein [Yinghuangia sp. ASG 101]|uniref:PhzF family phenazine biosynthesis protein n=1 Tax=Yinghuangia sp. ASG 101 TaxID=2896848 RepID=UPI001E598C4A|nr:PhzF family phenazine biosynthesis protein [Yinghuangia sp. ASG 101]UGQ10780.1 PhzF family phenazine biosynthesis protein [Yinghuangia sp. ASG 101]
MRIFVVDAFSGAAFRGNPAGVCLPEGARASDASWMRAVAAEMRHSETAFLVPAAAGGGADWSLRWFTPEVEVDLCGHATLASAYVLFGAGLARGSVRFATRSGVLTAHERPGGGIALDFPALPPRPVEAPEGLGEMLGVRVAAVAEGGADLVVEVASADEVRAVVPDLAALGRLPYRCVVVTAPGDGDGVDFVSRVFAPAAGIPEDPVTGSAHCVLGPYWAPRVGRSRLTGFQASARGGVVVVESQGDRVTLVGEATLVLRGELTV